MPAKGVTNSYDGFGRLTSSTLLMDGTSRTVARAYDDSNNRVTLTYNEGQQVTYAFDSLGRLGQLFEGAGTTTLLTQFSHNPQGLLAAREERYGSIASFGHDALGRLTMTFDTFAGGTGTVSSALAYNPAGQIASTWRDNDAYAWPGAYNVNRNYAVNGLNQYTAAGSTGLAYDANGNLVSETPPSPAPSTSFTYDVENRLVAASGSRTAALRYDPLGRLYEVTGASGTTRFLHDGDALVAEYSSAGALTARYVHGTDSAADDPLIWYDANGTRHWLHRDHQGSITGITDGAGAIQSINAYDEYGIPKVGNVGRFQYTGQIWLAELGMYYYKARIYSPTLGRFLQTDPVGYQGGINLYAYVGNDPVNMTDPSGTLRCAGGSDCEKVHIAARAARAAAQKAGADLRGLAGAIRDGTELTPEQQTTRAAYERRFGAGSARPSSLISAARHFDRVANNIGERGSGMYVHFRTSAQMTDRIAEAAGNSLRIGPRFFGEDGGRAGFSQAYVIMHEGGHAGGLADEIMPPGAPGGLGRTSLGHRRGYGVGATDWLGTHAPLVAAKNNDSYICFAIPACGGP